MDSPTRRSRSRRFGVTVTAVACTVAMGAQHSVADRGAQNLTVDAPPGPAATGVEVEPSVAVVPGAPRQVAVAWNQQLLDGGWEVVVALTGDGGATWSQLVPPGLTDCAPSAGAALGVVAGAAGLPSLSYGPDRRLYLAALCYVPNTTVNKELVATLAPDTASWTTIALGSGTRGRVVADPKVAGSAYVAYLSGLADTAHSVLVRHTRDGGRSWLPPTTAYSSQGDDAYTADITITGHAAHSGPARLLVALHGGLDPNTCCTFTMAARSDDDGAHWSPVERIPDGLHDYNDVWPSDPEPSNDPRDANQPYGSSGPPIHAAADGHGNAYVVWSNVDTSGRSQLLVSRTGIGAGWSTAFPVNSQPARAFEPQIAVSSDGTLTVTYYDDRSDRLGDDAWTVDLWQAVSHDGGSSWQETHLAGPMDIRAAVRPSLFTDYFGVAAVGDDVLTAYIATPGLDGATGATEGPTDVYLVRTHQ